jgi:hypothetical protein
MPWFDKKVPQTPAPPTAEELHARELAQLAAKIDLALARDPVFQFMTVDGLHWLCPYTGVKVGAPFGYHDAAKEHLMRVQPWNRLKPKTADEMRQYRWQIWLRDHIELETRFRLYSEDGRWLNPFTGTWARLSRRVTQFHPEHIPDMAAVLCTCPQAEGGKHLMPMEALQAILRESLGKRSSTEELGPAVNATMKISDFKAGKSGTIQAAATSFDEDMDKAGSIIQRLLAPLPSIEGYGLLVHYEPHSTVGGDFYECFAIGPGQYFIGIADVTGHGVQGAMVVVAALKALRFVLKTERDLITVLCRFNDEIRGDLLSGQFITFCGMILDTKAMTLQCVCAGHHPLVRLSQKRAAIAERIGLSGPAIGLVSSEMLKRALRSVTIDIAPGDLILAWTDGISEATDLRGNEYGDFKLIAAGLAAIEKGYDELAGRIINDARRFAEGQFADDVTLLALAIHEPPDESADEAIRI